MIHLKRFTFLLHRSKRNFAASFLIITLLTLGITNLFTKQTSANTGGYPHYNVPCAHKSPDGTYKTTGTSYWCKNYDWSYTPADNNDNIDQSLTWSSRKYGYRNCTDYVAWRVQEEFGKNISGLENATKWDNNAPSKGLKVRPTGEIPEIGDIAQFEGDDNNQYTNPGHVAFVTGVNPDGTVNVDEYNKLRDGNFYQRGPNDKVKASHYIDVNGPNPPGSSLNTGTTNNPTNTHTPINAVSNSIPLGQGSMGPGSQTIQNPVTQPVQGGSSNLLNNPSSDLVVSGPKINSLGTNPSSYIGKIVQWDGDTKSQKTSWLVTADKKRYWIPDGGVISCLKGKGYADAGLVSSSILDQLPDQNGRATACDGDRLGTNRYLFRNAFIKSPNGRYILTLQGSDGNLVMYEVMPDKSLKALWSNSQSSDYLVMQSDGNLVTYAYGRGATWHTGTYGTSARDLLIQNDGNFVLYAPGAIPIWARYQGRISSNLNSVAIKGSGDNLQGTSTQNVQNASTSNIQGGSANVLQNSNSSISVPGVNASDLAKKIVQWKSGNNQPNTSWFVSQELKRYWIPDGGTFNCLKSAGYPDAGTQQSNILNQLRDQSGQWVTCGGNILGTNRFMFRNTYIKSPNGRYMLILQGSDGNLVMYDTSTNPWRALWANSRSSDFLVMQGDGNLVTYAYGRGATWHTSTGGTSARDFLIQDDGNFVLYAPGALAIWARYQGRIR